MGEIFCLHKDSYQIEREMCSFVEFGNQKASESFV